MRPGFISVLAAAVLIVGFTACDNAADGSKDKASGAERSSEAASAAMSLTPDIKAAIIANPMLNEDGNLIDVDTTTTTVSLNGRVRTQRMKDVAGELARTVMAKNKSTLILKNNLTVTE